MGLMLWVITIVMVMNSLEATSNGSTRTPNVTEGCWKETPWQRDWDTETEIGVYEREEEVYRSSIRVTVTAECCW